MTKPKTLTKTSIEWTDYSWNPIRARNRRTGKTGHHCEHASPGCLNCYSEKGWNRRFGTGLAFTRQNRDAVDVFLDEERLHARMPRAPAKIFLCDMTDMFAGFVPDEWIDRILDVAELHPRYTYQLLTKRPERMLDYLAIRSPRGKWPMSNVRLGTSVEDGGRLERLDVMRVIPAAIRFVSFEPLLEDLGAIYLDGIDWVITGAESGSGARPMYLDWVRNIRDHCVAAGVPFFFKQNAARGKKLPTPEPDGRQWHEFPVAHQTAECTNAPFDAGRGA